MMQTCLSSKLVVVPTKKVFTSRKAQRVTPVSPGAGGQPRGRRSLQQPVQGRWQPRSSGLGGVRRGPPA